LFRHKYASLGSAFTAESSFSERNTKGHGSAP